MNRIAISLLALCALILGGCGSDARSQTPAGPASAGSVEGSILNDIGDYASWAGGIGLAACGFALAVTFIPILQPFVAGAAAFGITRKVIIEAGVLAFATILLGLAFLYLGHHPWILYASIGAVVVALLIRYHAWLAAHIYPSPQVATAPVVTAVAPASTITKP
jgi:hypothetical protein